MSGFSQSVSMTKSNNIVLLKNKISFNIFRAQIVFTLNCQCFTITSVADMPFNFKIRSF
jgi:uncharacterized protein YehS (DUF1456 family)